MFVDDSLKFCVQHDLMPPFDGCESVFIETECESSSNLIVGNVYRAPGTYLDNFNSFLTHALMQLPKRRSYVILWVTLILICSTVLSISPQMTL